VTAGPPPCPTCRGRGRVFVPDPPVSVWRIHRPRCPVCRGERTIEPERVADGFPNELPANEAMLGCVEQGAWIHTVSGELGGRCKFAGWLTGDPHEYDLVPDDAVIH